jgi:hypothetical protein
MSIGWDRNRWNPAWKDIENELNPICRVLIMMEMNKNIRRRCQQKNDSNIPYNEMRMRRVLASQTKTRCRISITNNNNEMECECIFKTELIFGHNEEKEDGLI